MNHPANLFDERDHRLAEWFQELVIAVVDNDPELSVSWQQIQRHRTKQVDFLTTLAVSQADAQRQRQLRDPEFRGFSEALFRKTWLNAPPDFRALREAIRKDKPGLQIVLLVVSDFRKTTSERTETIPVSESDFSYGDRRFLKSLRIKSR